MQALLSELRGSFGSIPGLGVARAVWVIMAAAQIVMNPVVGKCMFYNLPNEKFP